MVLGEDESELIATVTDFDLQPLNKRFEASCEDARIGKLKSILKRGNCCALPLLNNCT